MCIWTACPTDLGASLVTRTQNLLQSSIHGHASSFLSTMWINQHLPTSSWRRQTQTNESAEDGELTGTFCRACRRGQTSRRKQTPLLNRANGSYATPHAAQRASLHDSSVWVPEEQQQHRFLELHILCHLLQSKHGSKQDIQLLLRFARIHAHSPPAGQQPECSRKVDTPAIPVSSSWYSDQTRRAKSWEPHWLTNLTPWTRQPVPSFSPQSDFKDWLHRIPDNDSTFSHLPITLLFQSTYCSVPV